MAGGGDRRGLTSSGLFDMKDHPEGGQVAFARERIKAIMKAAADPLSRVLPLFPYLCIPAAVLGFFHRALTFHFWPDDWVYVGPPAARAFLRDPLSVITTPISFHYTPVQKSWNAMQSVLFREHPLPYHVTVLVLLSAVGILIYHLLRRYGLSLLPALAGGLYFTSTANHTYIACWIEGAHYLLFSSLLLLTHLAWERALEGEDRRWFLWTGALFLAALLTQSLGVIIPFSLLLRYHLMPRDTRKVARTRIWTATGAYLSLIPIFSLLPRLLFAVPYPGTPGFEWVRKLPRALYNCIFQQTVPGIMGVGMGIYKRKWMFDHPSFYLLAGLLAVILLCWLWRRDQWRVAVLGAFIALAGWALPFIILNWSTDLYYPRYRYLVIPNVGVALVLAALLAPAAGVRWRRSGAMVVLSFLLLFLVRNRHAAETNLMVFHRQDRVVAEAADRYRREAEKAARGLGPCKKIFVIDYPLSDTWDRLDLPAEEKKFNLIIQRVDHGTFHRFYFADSPAMLDRFEFYFGGPLVKDKLRNECVLVAFGGRMMSRLPSGDQGR
jgi:hypothetical protein